MGEGGVCGGAAPWARAQSSRTPRPVHVQVNAFYTTHEASFAQRLQQLAVALSEPKKWLPNSPDVGQLAMAGGEVTLATIVPTLRIDEKHAASLREFLQLCAEVRTAFACPAWPNASRQCATLLMQH